MTTTNTKLMMTYHVELDFTPCEEHSTSDFYDELQDHEDYIYADCHKKIEAIAENWVWKHYETDSLGNKFYPTELPWEDGCDCEFANWIKGYCWVESIHDPFGNSVYGMSGSEGVDDCPCVDCNDHKEWFEDTAKYYNTTVEEHFKGGE